MRGAILGRSGWRSKLISGARHAAPLPLLLLLLGGCDSAASRPPVHAGPIVLITFDSLRADAVSGLGGPPGLTPNLAQLAREADWAGPAVASSSWSVPSMASLFTGLRPWQHQAILTGQAALAPELITLPEALQARGYKTAGYPSGSWYTETYGYNQGFDTFEGLARGRAAGELLSRLTAERRFVWIHLLEPRAPYLRRDWLVPRLGPGAPAELPRRITQSQLQAFADPAVTVPPHVRRRVQALYRLNAAWADERLGRLLGSLRASGQWDRTLLIVTSNQGEDLGESHAAAARFHGGSLERRLLEVPLIVKLPKGFERPIAASKGERVAAARIWATMVEAAGGTVPPAQAPSLFQAAPAGAVSELYEPAGQSRLSLVEGDRQLLWETRPAAAPAVVLERWTPGGGTAPLADPAGQAVLARHLAAQWGDFLPARPGDADLIAEAREWGTSRVEAPENTPGSREHRPARSEHRARPRRRGDILTNRPAGLPRVHSSAVRASGS